MIINLILLVVVFLDVILGILVLVNTKRSLNNIFFFLLSLWSSVWTFSNFMTGIYATPFWLESTYALGALVISSALVWIFYLADNKLPYKPIAIISPFVAVLFFGSYYPGFIAKNYQEIYSGGAFVGNPGWGLALYTLLFGAAALVAFYKLLHARRLANSKEKKDQFLYVFYGCVATISISLLTSFLFPLFSIYQFSGLDSVGFLVFLSCIAYAILRSHLFDIKVIATELLTFIIWIALFAQVFYSNDWQDALVNSGILVFVVVFGIFLIRSVIKEVKQREEMAKMAEDVRRAYVVEKKAKEQLEQLDQFKDRFLTQTQHDLRTPLTAIMGYTDMIRQGMFGKQTKKTLGVIEKIQLVSKNMKAKADSFLDLAQFQLGKSPVSLQDGVEMFKVLDEVKSELDFKAQTKGIYLKLEKPDQDFMVRADKEKLKAAIFNIVDNAVKYTPKGGVTISLHNHDTVKIIIADTGIGVAKDKVDSIFGAMFERGEEAKKVAPGAGIGLYLSAQIIKAHNGKVWVESEGEGKGSVFHIELPLQKQPTTT